MRTIGKLLVQAIAVGGITALSMVQTAQKPQFEVASVKPNATGSFQIDFDASKGRFVRRNITAVILLQ